jgi:proteasome assembly chaperone (PAC2) family protein
MTDAVEIWEQPKAEEIYMLAGWRQWADAGSVSSGLPNHLILKSRARQIGRIRPDGFYLFQIPGTHDLVRPMVKFKKGYPEFLERRANEIFYTGDEHRGVIIFIGDEPHLDAERYVESFLSVAKDLGVKRIINLGGVYGELPYNRERLISSVYSLPHLKDELDELAVNYSDYHGGASIGSYICRRAGDQEIECIGLYAFVPSYELPSANQTVNAIRIENDFTAWLGIMRRVNYMLNLDFDLSELEDKSDDLYHLLDSKVEEIHKNAPQLGVHDYLQSLSENFTENIFTPLDDIWEDEIRRLFDKMDPNDE